MGYNVLKVVSCGFFVAKYTYPLGGIDMLKPGAITVANGADLLIFPADKSGLGYFFPKGLIPDDVLLSPTKAIKERGLVPKIKLAWNSETNNLVAQSVDGVSGINGQLSERIRRVMSAQMKDFYSLRDFFPASQMEDFATVAILRTAHITNYTPEEARGLAQSLLDHRALTDAATALSSMGFNPNRKRIQSANPLASRVGQHLLDAEDEATDDDAVDVDSEATTQ
jgi:hypothetical protein